MHGENSWTSVRLGDVAKVISGYAFRSTDFQDSGVPVIKIANIRVGDVDLSETEKVNPTFLSLDDKYHVRRGDILISLTGSHLTQPSSVVGRVALFRDSVRHCLLNQRAGKVIVRERGPCDARFLFYVLSDPSRMHKIATLAHGAASQANVSPTQVESLDLRLPPFKIQCRIASVLSAYDELIENNTRRIEILEEMAKMIYREWFVNFRFPSYEKIKMVESEMGSIPEGWTVEPLRELTTLISRGISPQYDDAATGLVVNQKCIRDGRLSLEPSRKQSKKVPEDKLIRVGDVLINSTGVGTLGRVAQVLEPISDCTVDSHVSIVRPKTNSEFLGKTLLQLEQHFERLGIGSTGQTELSRERIGSTRLVVPTPDLRERFSRVVAPMNEMIVCCLARNSNLRQTRDLLLPKLISGEVSVKQLESEAVAQGV